jgi:hypothetical protein
MRVGRLLTVPDAATAKQATGAVKGGKPDPTDFAELPSTSVGDFRSLGDGAANLLWAGLIGVFYATSAKLSICFALVLTANGSSECFPQISPTVRTADLSKVALLRCTNGGFGEALSRNQKRREGPVRAVHVDWVGNSG